MKEYKLGCGHLGNGITVWNRAKEVSGDYEKVAHIDADRQVTWYIKNPPGHVSKYVFEIAEGPNPSVSESQQEKKVFRR